MNIIADSGSTKTDWILVDKGELIKILNTIGFNPYYYSAEHLNKIVQDKLIPALKDIHIEQIFFYGSGCSTKTKKQIIIDAILPHFPNASIEVEHDLTGAARALLGKKEGIACILGTGANSCFYDGKIVTHNIPSLGYFFGDEGSGAELGKRLLNRYLKNQLPIHLHKKLELQYDLTLEKVLDGVYNQDKPNQFLSAFSPFLSENIKDKYIQDFVTSSFFDFFDQYVSRYPKYNDVPVNFIGSVAIVFEDLLRGIATEFNVKIEKIIKTPIEGLIDYHNN